MVKISYEENKNKSTVQLHGTSWEVFRGICRIIVNAKEKIKIKDDKSFEELLLEGIKTAEEEKKFSDMLKDKTEDELDSLLKLLESMLND